MLNSFRLIRLNPNHTIKPFYCGDQDLNDFLFNDAHNYDIGLFAVTYVIENPTKTVAFFSVLNDKISSDDFDSNRKFTSLIKNKFPERKKLRSYPAVKIGRLGIDIEFQNMGLGTQILDYTKQLFVNNNRSGCIFITVDAYQKSLGFYEANKFKYFKESLKENATCPMYFDLTRI